MFNVKNIRKQLKAWDQYRCELSDWTWIWNILMMNMLIKPAGILPDGQTIRHTCMLMQNSKLKG